jgi:hypothetical protein
MIVTKASKRITSKRSSLIALLRYPSKQQIA